VSPATPGWLLRPETGLCPCGCLGKRRKGSYVEKTIEGGADLLRRVLFTDDVAARDGLLQRVDPRVKVLGLVALIVATACFRHLSALMAMYALASALALASGLSVAFFLRRVWLFVPVFTGIVVLPTTCSFLTPGAIVVPLGTWFGSPVGLTNQGLTSAGLVVFRVATSISLVVLLTITTPWPRLLDALRSLHVPRMFVLVVGMAYRYIFLLLASVTEMYTARKARTVVDSRDVAGGRGFVSASAGALFGKAHATSEEVHQAMVARGYRGNARTLHRMRLGPFDLLFALMAVVVIASLFGADRLVRV
jgi:cobalt/nickel transport system permease protein